MTARTISSARRVSVLILEGGGEGGGAACDRAKEQGELRKREEEERGDLIHQRLAHYAQNLRNIIFIKMKKIYI